MIARRSGLGGVAFSADPGGWATAPIALPPTEDLVAADDPKSYDASAVWFPDRLGIWMLLAERSVSGRRCTEWFWPIAASGWSADLSTEETLRLATQRCFDLRGLTGTLQLVARLATGPGVYDLVSAIEPTVVLGWLVEIIPAAASPGLPDKRSRRRLRRELALPSPWRELLFALAETYTSRDPRVVWVLAAAVLDSATSPVLTPEFGLRVALGMRERIWEVTPETTTGTA